MGIFCEISICKPFDGAFVPGETVTGVIKYAIDEDTVFNKITVSLKGQGRLIIKDRRRRAKQRRSTQRYRNTEDYVDIDHIEREDDNGFPLPIGSYESKFRFRLPNDIPASLEYYKHSLRYVVKCNIFYYIRIKFDRPGFLKFAKRFKQMITVVAGITPQLSMEPTIFGEQKKLSHCFSCKTSVLNIKANVENTVVKPGGRIELNYEIYNDTSVTVKGVETKLVEIYKFVPRGHTKVKIHEDIQDTDTKTGSIDRGDTQSMDIKINVPFDIGSLENSKIVSRDYFVRIKVELPMPHCDALLEIPIQVGNVVDETENNEDPPPPYWQVMGEDHKDDEKHDDSDDE